MRRQADCPETGVKVFGRHARGGGLNRRIRCPQCGRDVAINYDGTLRHHVALLRSSPRVSQERNIDP
jgi:hypothetical protein